MAEHRFDRLFEPRQRRFACTPPHLLIRIREQRVDDLAEARSGIDAIFVGELFRADVKVGHLSPRMELYRRKRGYDRRQRNPMTNVSPVDGPPAPRVDEVE